MEESTKPRIRINAQQTAKGLWYFEATAETETVEQSASLLLEAVKRVEADFTAAGHRLAKEV